MLLLVRHGNTFSSEETPYWVGKAEDLPLVQEGFNQLRSVGLGLKPVQDKIATITTGPLVRTQQSAKIIAEETGYKGLIKVDSRLTEIDYGDWGGKTTEQIIAAGYQEELDKWEKLGIYPKNVGWKTTEQDLIAGVTGILSEFKEYEANLADSIHILVTSNGILRYFIRSVSTAYENYSHNNNIKVKTGYCCGMKYVGNCWQVVFWNLNINKIDFLANGE